MDSNGAFAQGEPISPKPTGSDMYQGTNMFQEFGRAKCHTRKGIFPFQLGFR